MQNIEMIPSTEIAKESKQWQLEDHILEKDYVLGWLLWGISKHPILSQRWILKGGACVKKCYVDTHRYSLDLDFTVLPDGPWQPHELESIFTNLLDLVQKTSGIDFGVQKPKFEIRPHGGSTEAKLYFVGPRKNPAPIGVKIDITMSEDLVRPPVLRSIAHPYSDSFPDKTSIYCYSLEELFAEKIRALGERQRPGDLYDIIYLFRRSDLHAEPELIAEILAIKCAYKEILIPDFNLVTTAEARVEMEKRWQDMLGKGLGVVPDFDDYWDELAAFFAWINGEEYITELQSIDPDKAWEAPVIDWQCGQNEWLEPIRYAAANRLLIDLGYEGRTRLVEPYSLRSTRAGHILFYAIKSLGRETRAYRIDRIQSITVTRQPFRPIFPIEFTPKGRVNVPRVQRRQRFSSSWSTRNYVVECSVCGKRFYRDKYSLKINPHKREGMDIPCSGRHGYLA